MPREYIIGFFPARYAKVMKQVVEGGILDRDALLARWE